MTTELEVIEGGGKPGGPSASPSPKRYRATIYPKDKDIDSDFAAAMIDLERILECKIWVIINQGNDNNPWDEISETVARGFRQTKADIGADEPCALLLDSPGGSASAAYDIVRLFQRRTSKLLTIVPVTAKSAATLIAIGGTEIVMGMDAELGPLDVQMYDDDKEEWGSALNAVQSFERLNAYALTAYDQAMQLFVKRMRKKPLTLMPMALQYATSIVGPMAEKIDTLEVTSKARELKVAEDYAVRIMRRNYRPDEAKAIAGRLVDKYSTHGFIIDIDEAGTSPSGRSSEYYLGLKIREPSAEIEQIFEKMTPFLMKSSQIIAGRIVEVSK